jgi:hypothetical protein
VSTLTHLNTSLNDEKSIRECLLKGNIVNQKIICYTISLPVKKKKIISSKFRKLKFVPPISRIFAVVVSAGLYILIESQMKSSKNSIYIRYATIFK